MNCNPNSFNPVPATFKTEEVFDLLGANRNNVPERVQSTEASIPNSHDGKSVRFRSGAEGDEIILKTKKTNGGSFVAVFEKSNEEVKILGCVPVPESGDGFFAYIGGQLQFVNTLSISKSFDNIGAGASGKLAIIGCGPNGTSILEFLAGNGSTRTIKIDGDGNIVPVNDSVVDATKKTYEDKQDLEIYTFSGGSGTYNDNSIYDLGVENAGKFAVLKGDLISGNSGREGLCQLNLSCNGRRVVRISFDNHWDNVCDDEGTTIVPIDSNGKLNIALTVSNVGDCFAKMFLIGIITNI